MGLAGISRKAGGGIGRGIAGYAEDQAKKQNEIFEQREWFYGLNPTKKQQVISNLEWQREFDNSIDLMMEEKMTIPKIVGLDLRG